MPRYTVTRTFTVEGDCTPDEALQLCSNYQSYSPQAEDKQIGYGEKERYVNLQYVGASIEADTAFTFPGVTVGE